MGTVSLRTLEDMARWHADLQVQCRVCGRKARFNADNMIRWFKSSRWSTSLDDAPRRFRCAGADGQGCGSKNVRLSAVMPKGQMPPERPQPISQNGVAPPGIDQMAWNNANERERKRLVQRLRS